jgi:hypothetical protein
MNTDETDGRIANTEKPKPLKHRGKEEPEKSQLGGR